MEDTKRWLTLARAPGLHAGQLVEWLAQGHRAPELLAESPATCAALGLGPAVVKALRHPDPVALERDLQWLSAGARRRLVTWGSDVYPPLLARIPDPPLVLYVEGDADALSLPQLAIVGSRNPTGLGRDTAAQFAAQVSRAGLVVTSGLALGIDAAAHRGALQAGARTVAVVGRGLDAI